MDGEEEGDAASGVLGGAGFVQRVARKELTTTPSMDGEEEGDAASGVLGGA